jgi:hypothetical protein
MFMGGGADLEVSSQYGIRIVTVPGTIIVKIKVLIRTIAV